MQIFPAARSTVTAFAGLALLAPLTVASPAAPAEVEPGHAPGGAGIGDPYFPRDGNGGYDVRHYALDLTYRPRTNRLSGTARITARAERDLSTFNLDLDGLRVRSVRVKGRKATWSRAGGELTVDPAGRGLERGERFRVTVRYAGVPRTIREPGVGASGFLHTDDGALVIGQPHVAATWFPVNDHPADKASYTFRITAAKRLEVVANGVLKRRRLHGGMRTWVWTARAPMAPYLATVNVGQFRLKAYRRHGVRYWDAVDPDLFDPVARPRSGRMFAISGMGSDAYKRLSRVLTVPAEGARLTFRAKRTTEEHFDFMMVEARPVGTTRWTTLPDRNGHTTRRSSLDCAGQVATHPFLRHYLTVAGDKCRPRGTTGRWHAVSGKSRGYERWSLDLGRYAGRQVQVAISYVTDSIVEEYGIFVDDIVVSTGEGSTSFEQDGDVMDGWSVRPAPASSPGNPSEWTVGTTSDLPPSKGTVATSSFARQDAFIRFLSRRFGRYPFKAAGGIVDDRPLSFALETQTRPVYGSEFFTTQLDADLVVVHELAHQWYGDSLTVKRWRHIWLNEGFATYAEWMWMDRQGIASARQLFRELYSIPAGDPFWRLRIGDPGPQGVLEFPVYARGAMTLHRLRTRVGDETFFRILRRWSRSQAGGHVTTREFRRLAERVSGRELDGLFRRWLFTPRKPGARGSHRTAGDVSAVTRKFAVRHPAR